MRQEMQITDIYSFNELSDTAKESAREWWRDSERGCSSWSDGVINNFETIAQMLGVEFSKHDVPLVSGKTRSEPDIWFTGFWSQGDGACFEGWYSYSKGAAKAIRQYAPQDTALHSIADDLQATQCKSFYQLHARLQKSGNYCHEYCVSIDVSDGQGDLDYTDERIEGIQEPLRKLMRWLYRSLEDSYNYIMSDENVEENIIANEYEFTADGEIYG